MKFLFKNRDRLSNFINFKSYQLMEAITQVLYLVNMQEEVIQDVNIKLNELIQEIKNNDLTESKNRTKTQVEDITYLESQAYLEFGGRRIYEILQILNFMKNKELISILPGRKEKRNKYLLIQWINLYWDEISHGLSSSNQFNDKQADGEDLKIYLE